MTLVLVPLFSHISPMEITLVFAPLLLQVASWPHIFWLFAPSLIQELLTQKLLCLLPSPLFLHSKPWEQMLSCWLLAPSLSQMNCEVHTFSWVLPRPEFWQIKSVTHVLDCLLPTPMFTHRNANPQLLLCLLLSPPFWHMKSSLIYFFTM